MNIVLNFLQTTGSYFLKSKVHQKKPKGFTFELFKIFQKKMTAEQKEILLNYATLSYQAPIIYIVFKDNVEIGFPEIRELTAAAEKLSDNKPYVVFADACMNVQVTKEGRRAAANEKEAAFHKGCAVLIKSNMLVLAINFFNGLISPTYPYRAFTDKQEAMDWLLKLPLDLQ